MRRLSFRLFTRSLSCAAVALLSTFGPARGSESAAPATTPLDVCALVPIADVAKALGAQPAEAKLFQADDGTHPRCRYTVVGAGGARGVFLVWVHAPEQYAGLRDAAEPPVTELKGVGDAAHATFDKDTGRRWLAVLVRGSATLQVSGEKLDDVRRVAEVAIARLRSAGAAVQRR